ncbi:lipid II flippase MurJ [Bacillus sp. N9]
MLVGTILSFVILFSRLPVKRMTTFDKDAIRLIKKSIPLLISGGLGVINTFVDKSFATLFDAGILTIISYSIMIVLLISSLITNAISGASYSFIVSEIGNNQINAAQSRIKQINFFFLFIYSLICILFILMGKFFLMLLFHRGHITLDDIDILYRITLILLPMTLFTSMGTIVIQTFYSFQNLKVTTIVNSCCVLLNIGLNILFIKHFSFYTLAGSTLISSLISTLINAYLLKRRYKILAINNKIILMSLMVTVFSFSTLFFQNLSLKLVMVFGLLSLYLVLFKKENKEIKTLFKSYVLRAKG